MYLTLEKITKTFPPRGGVTEVTAVDDINLKVDGFSTAKDTLSQLKLDLLVNKSGKVGVSGSLGLDPLKAQAA